MNKDKFLKTLKESFIILIKNYKILWIGISVELLFILLYGFFSAPLFNGIETNLIYLGDEIISESESLAGNFANIIGESVHSGNIIVLSGILILVAYVLYCFFQGFLWRFSLNLAGGKEEYIPYIKRFFLINLFWYPIFIVYILVNFFFSYTDIVGRRYDANGFFFFGEITNIILIIILYFAFISYVMIEKHGFWKSIKGSFRIGTRKALWLIITYLIIGVMFLLVNYILILVGLASYMLVVFSGIFIVMPAMIWARILIKEVIKTL